MRRINVTEPFLPPLEEYVEYLNGIWERNWLTNQGPLVQEFENKLKAYHQLSMPVHCVANGSLGLQIALKALGVEGEVITTPFSYVATTACPLWEGCTVKFADIEPDTLTIDPKAVEAAIAPQTEAILATHVFGNPCDVEALEAIAKKHGLALIYDAAHAFGVTYKGKSILNYGDASMVSLHATKLIHAVEGGLIVAKDPAVSEKMEWMRRFGHQGEEAFHGVGMNAKMSEFHAVMGLCCLNHIDEILRDRRQICDLYDDAFGFTNFEVIDSQVFTQQLSTNTCREMASRNYAYYPVIFDSESRLLEVVNYLQAKSIFPRRYFYPSINTVNEIVDYASMPVSGDLSRRILCLPLYWKLENDCIDAIIQAIKTHAL